MSAPRRLLTSLLLVEEKLLEANYFIQLMRQGGPGPSYGYCLSAFVSASRSVTFLLQKEMAHVPGFDDWWQQQQARLKADPVARFFLKIRNYSQKEGRISLVGSGNSSGYWTYRFGGNVEKVPTQLLMRDVAECCSEHVAKLAALILLCVDAFPYYTCPRRACTPEGFAALGLEIDALFRVLGYPSEWLKAARGIPLAQQFNILRRDIDGLDLESISFLAGYQPPAKQENHPDDTLGHEWADLVVDQLENNGKVDRAFVAGMMLLRGWERKRSAFNAPKKGDMESTE